ncbi:MAG: hypothetical protein KGY44_02600 [Halanaerobiales bacterium]|nr:hypothetical protein [Halanaerobiales bacterium]
MSFFDKIKKYFTPSSNNKIVNIYLQDEKCGNKMKVVLRKGYDIQRVYKENIKAKYQISKVIVCDKCYNNIMIDIKFDKNYNIISKNIENGEFISKEIFLDQ